MENQEKFEGNSETYTFKDGRFSFWEGEVNGKTVVIRVREDDNAGKRWVEKELPRGITIHPANSDHVREWLEGHPEYELS